MVTAAWSGHHGHRFLLKGAADTRSRLQVRLSTCEPEGLLPSLLVRAALERTRSEMRHQPVAAGPATRAGHRDGHSDQVLPGQQGHLGGHRRCRRQLRDGPVGPDPGTDEPLRAGNDHDAPVLVGHIVGLAPWCWICGAETIPSSFRQSLSSNSSSSQLRAHPLAPAPRDRPERADYACREKT
jgi:hypothetical protein